MTTPDNFAAEPEHYLPQESMTTAAPVDLSDSALDALDKDAADALSHAHQEPFSLVARNALLVCVGDQQRAIAALRSQVAEYENLKREIIASDDNAIAENAARVEVARLTAQVADLRGQLERAEQECAALRTDAERYRWLRGIWWKFSTTAISPISGPIGGKLWWEHLDAVASATSDSNLDAAIDAARVQADEPIGPVSPDGAIKQ